MDSAKNRKESTIMEAPLPVPKTNPKHVCTLKDIHNAAYMTQLPPFAPFFKRLQRGWRRFTLINETNSRTHECFHSNFAIFKEKQRHARTRRYTFIIHPFSSFCKYKDIVMCFLYLTSFIIEPFIASFLGHLLYQDERPWSTVMEISLFTLNLLMYVNVFFEFSVGYVVYQTKTVVLDPAKIAWHYLKTYFIFDMIAGFPMLIIFTREQAEITTIYLMFQLHIFRYCRLITVIRILSQWMRSYKIRDAVMILILIVLVAVLMTHWFSCVLFTMPTVRYYINQKVRSTSWTNRALIEIGGSVMPTKSYFQAILVTMSHFFGTGIGTYKSENDVELLVLSVIIVIGFVFYLVSIALILQVFGVVNISETKYEELRRQVEEYMMIKKIPPAIKKRMDSYYEYKFKKRFFMEQAIMASLSEHLRCEITLHCCKNLIENVLMFQGAPKAAVGRVLGMVQPEVFLAGDKIIGIDDLKENFYFIAWGTTAVYINKKELVHLEDGDYFGDSAEKISRNGEKNNYEVYAIEITELFCIPYADMMSCLATYPQVLDKLDKVTEQKSKLYAKLLETEVNISEDILSNLRSGRILEKSKKRV